MADYVDRQGNIISSADISPTEADAAIRRGDLALRGPVDLVVGDEVRRFEDPAEAKRQMAEGARLAGATETRSAELEKRFGSAVDVAGAVGAGLLSGATLGASDFIARRTTEEGEDNALLDVQEALPGASMTGNVASLLIPGLGLAGAAGKGARAARGVAGSLLAREGAGLGRRLLGRALEEGAEGAVVGGFFEGQRAISEAAIKDKDLTAQQFLGRVGMGAALGIGGGAAFGVGGGLIGEGVTALGRGARAVGGGTAEAVKKLWQSQRGTTLTDRAASLYGDLIRKTRGDAAGELVEAGLRGESRVVRALEEGDTFAAEAAPRLRQLLDESEAIGRQTREFSAGSLKRGQVTKNIRELDDAMAGEARSVIGKLDELADQMEAQREVFGTAGATKGRLRDGFTGFGMRIEKGIERGGREGAAEVFMALDDAKRMVGTLRSKATKSDGFVQETFENLYEQFRTTLEKTDLFGEAAAVQRDVNQTMSRYLANRRVFARSFLRGSGLQEGFDPVFTADPNAITRYLDQVGTGNNQLTDEVFRRHIELQSELFEKMARHYDLPPELAGNIGKSRESVSALRKTLADAEDIVSTRNQLRELDKGESALGGALGVGGQVLGTAIGGALGGGFGALGGQQLGRSLALAGKAISKPGAVIRGVTNIRRLADQFDARSILATKKYVEAITAATGSAARAAGKAASGAKSRAARASALGSVDAFRETVSQVQALAAAPGAVPERLAKAIGTDTGSAPQMTGHMGVTASRAVQFLDSKIPPGARRRRDPLQPNITKDMIASDPEIRKFMTYARAVNDPLVLLDDMQAGQLTVETVEAVREVYPGVFEQIQTRVMTEVSNATKPVPYDARLQLGILLDIPTDPSLTPSYIARMQSLYQTQPDQGAGAPPQPTGPQTAPAPKKLDRLAETIGGQMTDQQRIAGRRTG